MRSETRTQDWFLRDPRTRWWVVQCSACGLLGRKPDTPPVPKVRFEEMFPVLEVDVVGVCQHCRVSLERSATATLTSEADAEPGAAADHHT